MPSRWELVHIHSQLGNDHLGNTLTDPGYRLKEETTPTARSSQIELALSPVVTVSKQNLANDLATLGILYAKTNREQHPSIEDFMLHNDSSTIACETPIYLLPDEQRFFTTRGFSLTLPPTVTPVTGHIDLLQLRGGLIYILNYKPDAIKIRPVSQLLTYALAMASRTRLPLKYFKCAWSDEKDYFEFFPIHLVYKKQDRSAH